MNTTSKLERRFWAKVQIESLFGCWIWTAGKAKGYGKISVAGKILYSHRLSWEFAHGPIPDGMCVCHNCPGGDNPLCVNPAHLWLGTQAENMSDKTRKGRSLRGESSPQAKLSDADVIAIRMLVDEGSMSHREIAELYEIGRSTVTAVVSRENWKHL